MKTVLYLDAVEYLESALRIPAQEVVLQTHSFSVAGTISDNDLGGVIGRFNNKKQRIILLWDTICNDDKIDQLILNISRFRDRIDAVRFVDPGVGACLKQQFPDLSLQFLMWDAHQNWRGIQEWVEVFEPNLERIILSNQLTETALRGLRKETGVSMEVKGLGRMQIFYSARHLLTNGFSKDESNPKEIKVASYDRKSQVFPVIETAHGTVIFNDTDLSLLKRIQKLEEIGIDYLGIEPYNAEQFQLLENVTDISLEVVKIETSWPKAVYAGFFEKNQTDALLDKLTNTFLKDEKQYQVGTVLESSKGSHTLIQISKNLQLPCQVLLLTPERKTISHQIKTLNSLAGADTLKVVSQGFYLLPWIKFAVPGTILKLTSPNENEIDT